MQARASLHALTQACILACMHAIMHRRTGARTHARTHLDIWVRHLIDGDVHIAHIDTANTEACVSRHGAMHCRIAQVLAVNSIGCYCGYRPDLRVMYACTYLCMQAHMHAFIGYYCRSQPHLVRRVDEANLDRTPLSSPKGLGTVLEQGADVGQALVA